MLFITETLNTKINTRVDESDGKKDLYIEGIFLQDTIKNRNGRMYPKKVMADSVSKYKSTYIDNNRALGEMNHPVTPQVNPDRACIKIISITENGNDWVGKAKVLSTPLGHLLRNFIEDNVQLGVSSRGLGVVKESNDMSVVQNGYGITAIDTVFDPSAPAAFVNGIYENKEWIFENGILVECEIDMAKNLIDKAVRKTNFNDEFLTNFMKNIISNI